MNNKEKDLEFLKDYWAVCKKHGKKIQEFCHEELYNCIRPLHPDDELRYSDMRWKKGAQIRNIEITFKKLSRNGDYQKSID